MQTFLPLPSFQKSAQVLDYKRLGNQRNEALIIYKTIINPNRKAWQKHPCTLMWRPYSEALALYYNEILKEWIKRGFKNQMDYLTINQNALRFPPWIGHTAFHSSHRAALLYKNPEWYTSFGWCEQPKIKYIWPIYNEDKTFFESFGD